MACLEQVCEGKGKIVPATDQPDAYIQNLQDSSTAPDGALARPKTDLSRRDLGGSEETYKEELSRVLTEDEPATKA